MDQNLTHRNHYIPRFYLKNWSLDGKTIQTYSILVSNSKVPYWTQQSIKNSAVWSDFYTRIEGDKEIDDFEHWFDREFETPAKPVIEQFVVCKKQGLKVFKTIDKTNAKNSKFTYKHK